MSMRARIGQFPHQRIAVLDLDSRYDCKDFSEVHTLLIDMKI